MLAGEPDSFSGPRGDIFVSESGGFSCARGLSPNSEQTSSPSAGSGALMQPVLLLATAQPDCPLADAATYMPGVVCGRQQFVKQ
jgi:hypothetical protein